MKLLTHRQHHGKPVHHGQSKKSYKIMKKISKLERKLGKYNLSQSDSGTSSDEDCRRRRRRRSRGRVSRSRSRGASRTRGKPHGRKQFEHGKRANSSDSTSSICSTSSSSSRSPSPPRQNPHHYGPRYVKSAAIPCGHRLRGFLEHPHGPPHRRGFFGRHHRQHERGIPGWFAFLSQSEEAPANNRCEEIRPELVDLLGVDEEEEAPSNSGQMDEYVPEDESERGPKLNENLAKKWTEIAQKGLSEERRAALMKKYPVNANCLLLQAPRVNKEFLAVASKSAVERDSVRAREQNEISAGLAALGQALTDFEGKVAQDRDLAAVYDTLNEAAEAIVDAHRNIAQSRRALVSSELHRRVRPFLGNCEPDDGLLYGKDFGEKARDAKGFRKARKDRQRRSKEGERDDKRKSTKRPERGPESNNKEQQ